MNTPEIGGYFGLDEPNFTGPRRVFFETSTTQGSLWEIGLITEAFMKGITIFWLTALLILLPAISNGQSPDLSGTWTGETTLPGSTDKIGIILDLVKKDDGYTGTIAASKDQFPKAELQDVKLVGTLLKFQFVLKLGGAQTRLRVALNSFLGGLVGGWVTDEGSYAFGPMDLDRKAGAGQPPLED